MSVILIATMQAAPSRREEALEAITGLAPQVHAEAGCEKYAVHSSGKDGIVFVEKWADRECLDAHAQGTVFATMSAALAGLTIGETSIQVLRALPAGDPGKSAL